MIIKLPLIVLVDIVNDGICDVVRSQSEIYCFVYRRRMLLFVVTVCNSHFIAILILYLVKTGRSVSTHNKRRHLIRSSSSKYGSLFVKVGQNDFLLPSFKKIAEVTMSACRDKNTTGRRRYVQSHMFVESDLVVL